MAERQYWTVDDSSFTSYTELVMFQDGSALSHILARVGKHAVNSALDIAGGSNGRAVRDLIDTGIASSGVYTNMIDNRTLPTRSDVKLVIGDLISCRTWDEIKSSQQEVSPDGFAIALHRPYGGLQGLSTRQYIKGATKVVDMLRPGGVFYSQIPTTYAYDTRNESMISEIFDKISMHPDVEKIDHSVRALTLADHEFCLIYKRDTVQ